MILVLLHGVLLLRGRLARHAPPARFVHQPLDALLQKSAAPICTQSATADHAMAAMAVIGTPSATSKIILPRLARPSETVVARCPHSSVRRSTGVRWMGRARSCFHEP